MAEVQQAAAPAGPRHIIKRPRLTRLLDETSARVILLVAPAGYGKTTLAREWLAESGAKSAWYAATPAGADIATFAAGVALAAATVVPGAADELLSRIERTDAPEKTALALAETLARDLAKWPVDAWLVIDDYHAVAGSGAVEAFIEGICHLAPISLLVTSRERPAWSSARRVVYGEVCELDASVLAMTDEEAAQVLQTRGRKWVVEVAAGWPAVLGLAALANRDPAAPTDLPETLHDFFAEELYNDVEPTLHRHFALLALIPRPITIDRCTAVFGERAETVRAEALRLGFLPSSRPPFLDLHPLLRRYLATKLEHVEPAVIDTAVQNLLRHLIERAMWDDAFSVLEQAGRTVHLLPFLLAALPAALREGRLPTIDRWIGLARARSITSPIIALTEAEVALRRGQFKRADVYALNALSGLHRAEPEFVQALMIRGRSALLRDEYEVARELYDTAARASGGDVRRAALWGAFVARRYLECDDTVDVLEALERMGIDGPEASLRLSSARLQTAALRSSRLPIEDLEATAHLATDEMDPHAVTNFLQNYAYALMATAQYERALTACGHELNLADQYGLEFVRLNVRVVEAFAHLGLRRFERAAEILDSCQAHAEALDDSHNLANIQVARIRLLLAKGRAAEVADQQLVAWNRPPAPSMVGEYHATYAMALACAGEYERALDLVSSVADLTRSLEATTAAAFAQAIVAASAGDSTASEAISAVSALVLETRHMDGFVAAYRAYPFLLSEMLRPSEARRAFLSVIQTARDSALATRHAGTRAPSGTTLSAREREVLDLLRDGLSNRRIAANLYISEATVKVHVRHIFEKLNVRTRTEAALVRLTPDD